MSKDRTIRIPKDVLEEGKEAALSWLRKMEYNAGYTSDICMNCGAFSAMENPPSTPKILENCGLCFKPKEINDN